jgi:signal transduction histidine kinase
MPTSAKNDSETQRLSDQYVEIAQLAGGLAHEIKNPLSTIRMNMELLAEDLRESDSPRDQRSLRKIELVQRECQRLQDLLDNFLSYAKAHHLRRQSCDLNALIRRALDFYRPKARESKIEIIDYLTNDLPTLMLDPEAFYGAILNLIINAEQAMPDGGQIVVRTYITPDSVAMDLIDTGNGMDERTRSQIFEAFFSTKRGGSGLGLPTTRRIVEAHGGIINLQSEVGLGTRFTIQLPLPTRLPAEGKTPGEPA